MQGLICGDKCRENYIEVHVTLWSINILCCKYNIKVNNNTLIHLYKSMLLFL